ncbi:pantothenate transporter liz1 [Moniliophthora roreri]|nr:pantothenate transporter liz1 [Moniliophthora roreri]
MLSVKWPLSSQDTKTVNMKLILEYIQCPVEGIEERENRDISHRLKKRKIYCEDDIPSTSTKRSSVPTISNSSEPLLRAQSEVKFTKNVFLLVSPAQICPSPMLSNSTLSQELPSLLTLIAYSSRNRKPRLPVSATPQDPKHIHRARLILVWILHFYVHTLTPQLDSGPMRIPPSLSVPLLHIFKATDQPSVLTYTDEVILNSYLDASDNEPECLLLFNRGPGSAHEQVFHLTSVRIE